MNRTTHRILSAICTFLVAAGTSALGLELIPATGVWHKLAIWLTGLFGASGTALLAGVFGQPDPLTSTSSSSTSSPPPPPAPPASGSSGAAAAVKSAAGLLILGWLALGSSVAAAAGCAHPYQSARTAVSAVDDTLVQAEGGYVAWDLDHQRSLENDSAGLDTYRKVQRPKVLAAFHALASASVTAGKAIALAESIKANGVQPAQQIALAFAPLLSAATGLQRVASEIGWTVPGLSSVLGLLGAGGAL